MKCEAVDIITSEVCNSKEAVKDCIIQGKIARIRINLCSLHRVVLGETYKVLVIEKENKTNGRKQNERRKD